MNNAPIVRGTLADAPIPCAVLVSPHSPGLWLLAPTRCINQHKPIAFRGSVLISNFSICSLRDMAREQGH